MPSPWTYLKLPQEYDILPPILISHDFRPSSYTIWLTDLIAIWSESMDRRPIIQRAFALDTSIDPSEDAEQMRLLLRSIKDAYEQLPGTSLDLSYSGSGDQLTLNISTPLPPPLKPVQWSMSLAKTPQSTMTRKFIVPLIVHDTTSMAEKTSLMQQLKDKDAVIAKLINQLQMDGSDLSKVFPGAGLLKSSTKSNPRQVIGRFVKGLAEFNEEQWKTRIAEMSHGRGSLVDLISKFSGTGMDGFIEPSQIPEHDNWWERLAEVDLKDPTITLKSHSKANPECEDQTVIAHENDFQRQSTPPTVQHPASPSRQARNTPLSKRSSPLKTVSDLDGSTTDEDMEDRLSHASGAVYPKPSTVKPTGLVNRSSNDRADPVADEVEATTLMDEDFRSGVDLRSGDDARGPRTANGLDSASTLSENQSVSKTRSRLGKIGGKSAASTLRELNNDQQTIASAQPQSMEPTDPAPEVNIASTRPFPTVISLEDRGRKRNRDANSPSPPRETSEERANKRRAKLKQELESKSREKTKKKRKF